MAAAILIILFTFSTVGAVWAEATHGMVASVHPVATAAGLRVLEEGGNAVDATVAVALTLGVVNGENSGIGGGCFMLIHRADGSLVAIDGRETAPAAATADMFVRNGKADARLSQTGPLASGVAGALAAYEYAVEHYGRRKLSELILPAAQVAEAGFAVDTGYARNLKQRCQGHEAVQHVARSVFQEGQAAGAGRRAEATRLGGNLSQHCRAGERLVLSRAIRASGRAVDEAQRRHPDCGGFSELQGPLARTRASPVTGDTRLSASRRRVRAEYTWRRY